LLHEAFPPPELDDDEALKNWVRWQRDEWLNGNVEVPTELFQQNPVAFEAISNFIRRE